MRQRGGEFKGGAPLVAVHPNEKLANERNGVLFSPF